MRKFIKLIIILSSIAISCANAKNLPDLGNYNSNTLSPAQEQQLGWELMQKIKRQVPLVHDPLITNYIQALGDKLVAYTDNRKTKFHFFVVKNSSINAFSAPGGYVGVNAGLILTTRAESELAAVLAHEITHVNQRHIARAIERQKKLAIPTIAAMLAAIVLGTQASSSAAAGVIGAATGGSGQHMINFIRSHEQEADRIGIQTLYRAGFDPTAMPTFFKRMQKADLNYSSNIPEYLRTHPLTASRIADVKNRVQQYPKRNVKSNPDYYLMRARLRAALSNATKYFQAELKNKSYQNQDAATYGYALALLKAKHAAAATKVINHLLKKHPDQIIYQMASAQIKAIAHNPKTAITILQKSLEFYPDYYPLAVQYSATLIAAKEYHKAARFLDKQVMEHPHDILLYSLLAKAQGQAGNVAAVHLARAKIFALEGNPNMATIQLEQALRQSNLDDHIKNIINTQISTLKSLCRPKLSCKI